MPHISIHDRLWNLGGDELAIPTCCAGILRLFWIGCLTFIIADSFDRIQDCDNAALVFTYLSLSLVAAVIALIIEGLIIQHSLLGTPVETYLRVELPKWLTSHTYVGIIQSMCAVWGLFILFSDVVSCSNKIDYGTESILLQIVIISQLVDMIGTWCCCFVFEDSERNEVMESLPSNPSHSLVERTEELWERRCRTCCRALTCLTCFMFGGDQATEDLEMVGRVLTRFFHHQGFLDVVPSDVLVGLVLLRHKQRHEEITQALRSPTTSVRDWRELSKSDLKVAGHIPMSPTLEQDRALLGDAAHFSKFAVAIYSWMMFVYMHPLTGFCGLLSGMSGLVGQKSPASRCQPHVLLDTAKSFSYQNRPHHNDHPSSNVGRMGVVEGDNCSGMHEAALLELAKIDQTAIAYVNFVDDVLSKPYAILVDHETKSVVLTIRGTLSLEDCITDAQADPMELAESGQRWGFEGEGKFAHSGILQAAEWVRKDLEDQGVLTQLLSPRTQSMEGRFEEKEDIETGRRGRSEEGKKRRQEEAGGGGRGSGERGDVELDADLQKPLYTEASIGLLDDLYSLVVVGHSLGAGAAALLAMMLRPAYPDLVCFGYGMPGALVDEGLAEEMKAYVTSLVLGNDLVPRLSMDALESMRWEVLDLISRCAVNKQVLMKASLFSERDIFPSLVFSDEALPPSPFLDNLNQFRQYKARQRSLDLEMNPAVNTPLFPPGKLLYLAKVRDKPGCCSRDRDYTPLRSEKERFREVVISPSMVIDHFPDMYMHMLTRAYEAWEEEPK